MKLLISGQYNAFSDGFNGAGVYMASGLFVSSTFERPIYIGSAVDLYKRIETDHIGGLNKNEWTKRTNKPLWCAWQKHGANAFVWYLLEPCQPAECETLEQSYLDRERPFCDEMRGYNVLKYTNNNRLGTKHTTETKSKIGEAHKGIKMRGMERDSVKRRSMRQ